MILDYKLLNSFYKYQYVDTYYNAIISIVVAKSAEKRIQTSVTNYVIWKKRIQRQIKYKLIIPLINLLKSQICSQTFWNIKSRWQIYRFNLSSQSTKFTSSSYSSIGQLISSRRSNSTWKTPGLKNIWKLKTIQQEKLKLSKENDPDTIENSRRWLIPEQLRQITMHGDDESAGTLRN